jgi:hypothetical protein
MHPALLGHAGNQVIQQAIVHAHFFRHNFPYVLGNFESRNVALLHSDLVAFGLTAGFLRLLEVSSDAVDVRLAVQAEHLWRRREREARSIIGAVPEAMARIKYVGRREAIGRVVRTAVGECSDHRLLRCVVKFVPAESSRSGKDEAWLVTAYFLGQRELRRLLRRQEIRPLFNDA